MLAHLHDVQTMFKIIFLKQSDGSVLAPEQTLNQSINQFCRAGPPWVILIFVSILAHDAWIITGMTSD